MNTKITVLCFAFVISGCAIEPISMSGPDGKQGYTMNCDSRIEQCHQKAAELCPEGYDILDHAKKASTVVPNYGEYPVTIITESLTIQCR